MPAEGTNTYIYGPSTAQRSAQGGRLAQYQAAMQYFGADGLGSVRQLYDASAQVLANARYDPYGNVTSQYGTATSNFGFTGEQYDTATGLEYLRARYYSSAQGRFTTRDVWAGDPNAPMSYNGWSYADADPVNWADPSGRCTGGVGAEHLAEGFAAGLLNPLAWPKLYQGVSEAWEKCDENLSKAQQKYEQGNNTSAYAYGTGFLTTVEGGQGWIGGWNNDIELVTNNRFNKMAQQEPFAWWTRLRPEDLPDLLEIYKAECRIGSTGLTIASFITPGLMWVRGGLSASLEGVGRFSVPDEFMPFWTVEQEAAWAKLAPGRGFTSFAKLKQFLGPASEGNVWHHVVEQRAKNIVKSGAEQIHNTKNAVAVPKEVNQAIANYYSSKQWFTGGKTVRGWLESQSFEQQTRYGQMILQRVLEGQPLP